MSMKLNYIVSDSIPNGTKFVALTYDGSHGGIYMIDKAGHLINHNGDDIESSPDCYLTGSGFGYWIELPKSFKMWFEQRKPR